MSHDLSRVITGTGSHIPSRRVSNEEFLGSRFFSDYGSPLEPAGNATVISKFREITEIAERRYVPDDLVASDIACDAAAKAIESAGVDPETLDHLIVAHNFGDVRFESRRSEFVPTLAARVKQKLAIANPACIAYDLPFGCPGWLQAVIQVDCFLRSGDARKALVIGAETLSRVSDPHDRDSMIYSDGAGAAVIEARSDCERVGILAHAARSDTREHAWLLRMGRSFDAGAADDRLFLKMRGRKLYEYALSTVPGVVRQSLDRAGVALTDVRKVLIHQANGKMDEAILRRLFKLYGIREIPADIMPMTISWLGNSSVATLPTLVDLIRRGEIQGHDLNSGDIVVFASVGAGMNINSMVYRWP
ncbi:MAG: ketoacyl-ACP synthase III [Deltaproteobacteria bacterium]|nr:ketoacyl-ACP synthase III [Deltaproteobacteria bacterium]